MIMFLGLGKSSAAFLIDVYLSEFTSPFCYELFSLLKKIFQGLASYCHLHIPACCS
jgi:hypothetical protein